LQPDAPDGFFAQKLRSILSTTAAPDLFRHADKGKTPHAILPLKVEDLLTSGLIFSNLLKNSILWRFFHFPG